MKNVSIKTVVIFLIGVCVTAFIIAFILYAITSKNIKNNYLSDSINLDLKELKDFKKIKTMGNFEVIINQGKDYNVKLIIEEKFKNVINIEVKNDTLVASYKKDILFFFIGGINLKPKLEITCPYINELFLDGSGNFLSNNKIKTESMNIFISGSGKVKLVMDSNITKINIDGSGDVELYGNGDKLSIDISGSGNIKAYDFNVNDTVIDVSGSGTAGVNVKNNLDVKIDGDGDVKYIGNPKINQKISGDGSINSK